MRRLFLAAFLCGAMVAAAGAAEPSVPAPAAAIDARIADSRPFGERPLEGYAAEGARVSAWGRRSAIERISVEALGERGRSTVDFYYRGAALVAAHERRTAYGAAITDLPKDKPAPTTPALDGWVEYGAGGRVVRTIGFDRDDASSRAAELRSQARSLRRLMSTPDSARAGECTWACVSERGGECWRYRCR